MRKPKQTQTQTQTPAPEADAAKAARIAEIKAAQERAKANADATRAQIAADKAARKAAKDEKRGENRAIQTAQREAAAAKRAAKVRWAAAVLAAGGKTIEVPAHVETTKDGKDQLHEAYTITSHTKASLAAFREMGKGAYDYSAF